MTETCNTGSTTSTGVKGLCIPCLSCVLDANSAMGMHQHILVGGIPFACPSIDSSLHVGSTGAPGSQGMMGNTGEGL